MVAYSIIIYNLHLKFLNTITKVKYKLENLHYTQKIIKNYHNIIPNKIVDDVCPLPGAGQDHPLPFLLTPSHSD